MRCSLCLDSGHRWSSISRLRSYSSAQRASLCTSSFRVAHQASGDDRWKRQPTAGVISDEVLKGGVPDVNASYFCEKLTKFGVKVCRVSMIGDDRDVIAEEVRRFSKEHTYVVTSGGIGPTHDDVTFESVAKAFDQKIVVHPEIEEACKSWSNSKELSPAALKMAQVPEKAKLNYGSDPETGQKNRYPLVSVENVYIFPGVPAFLRRGMELMGKKLFYHPEYCLPKGELFFNLTELSIAAVLDKAVETFPKVTFGSYPVISHSYYKTQITMEAEDDAELCEAENFLRNGFSPECIVPFDRNPLEDRWNKLMKLVSRPDKEHLKAPVEKALQVIDECYHRFSPESVCLFFNGGKDCTAVLHLVSAYLLRMFPGVKLLAVDVIEDEKSLFPEVISFIKESEIRYNLEFIQYRGTLKEALGQLLKERPHIKAAFLGMRLGDPHAGDDDSAHFVPTTSDWPPLMRVYPILHFDYHVLWDFLRSLYLPYSTLYDRGYTSLGRVDTTYPNPALQSLTPDGHVTYQPAYRLEDVSKEREGRLSPGQKPPVMD